MLKVNGITEGSASSGSIGTIVEGIFNSLIDLNTEHNPNAYPKGTTAKIRKGTNVNSAIVDIDTNTGLNIWVDTEAYEEALITANTNAINQEITNRTNADNVLQANIDAEAFTRQTADTNLQNTKLNIDGTGLTDSQRIDLNLQLSGVPLVNGDQLPVDTSDSQKSAVGTVYQLKNTSTVNGVDYSAGTVLKISSNTGGNIVWQEISLSKTATTDLLNDNSANDTNRANHTGTQAISTIENLQLSLDGKFSKTGTNEINNLPSVFVNDNQNFLIEENGTKKRTLGSSIWDYTESKLGTGNGNINKITIGDYAGFAGVQLTGRIATAESNGQYFYFQNPTDGSVISANKYGQLQAVSLRLADMSQSASALVPIDYAGSTYSDLNSINHAGEYVLTNAQTILNKPSALPTNISNLHLKVIRVGSTSNTNLIQILTHAPSPLSALTYGQYERRQTGNGSWTAWSDITTNAYEVGYSIMYTTQSYTLNPCPNGKRWLTGLLSYGGQAYGTFQIRANITYQYAFDKIPSGYFSTAWTRFVCCNISYNASTRSIAFTHAGFKEVQTGSQDWYNQMGNNQWSIISPRYE